MGHEGLYIFLSLLLLSSSFIFVMFFLHRRRRTRSLSLEAIASEESNPTKSTQIIRLNSSTPLTCHAAYPPPIINTPLVPQSTFNAPPLVASNTTPSAPLLVHLNNPDPYSLHHQPRYY
eukprot:GDKJ01025605.1.p1 GENE.GDKJ01025605.1~~GDKJ01025605.1.p1  ORF type:complete len:119 (-),score=10.58 GDKJ01025605.1:218-574(-)